MPRPTHIAADLTVRQVVGTWPGCAAILAAHPASRQDGRWTLQDLSAFAVTAGLDPDDLLAQLATAAGVPLARRAAVSPRGASPVPLIFVALAIVLTLGGGWGVLLLLGIAFGANYAAVSPDAVHVHGVAQLWGWMTLFIFAVATHLLRQNTRRPAPPWLERVAGAFIVTGLVCFFAGLTRPVFDRMPWIDIAASAFLAAAAILFGVSILWSLAGAPMTQRRHGFAALVGWLWAWAAADLYFRIHYAAAPVLPDSARSLLIVLPVLGLATNAIYGFGIKLIPGLLNIAPLRQRAFSAALILHNVGLLAFLVPLGSTQTLGAAAMLAGSIFYLLGMDGLRSKPSRPIYGVDPRAHILIRAAFFWLVAGLAMILLQTLLPTLPHAYAGAWRHALTVGFITTMILGVGQRIVPVFIKQPLASSQMMLAAAALILLGNAGRVTLELLTIGNWPWAYELMGFTGVLELAALLLFAIDLALTARNRRRTYRATDPLTPGVRVRDAVNARPELQHRLRALGITMFDDVPFIAPSMTFGALAFATARQPRDLIADLNNPPPGPLSPDLALMASSAPPGTAAHPSGSPPADGSASRNR